MKLIYTFLLLWAIAAISCKSTKPLAEVNLMEETLLDTLTVTASKPTAKTYELPENNPAEERKIDLKHMDLDISFDMALEQVIGTAELSLSPYFYPTNQFSIDAHQMEIKEITMANNKLKYSYNGEQILINLDRTYTRKEDFTILIKYIAKPTLGRITGDFNASDQGLYFIDSDQSHPDKPTQIWSQGETEYNSHWFPTVDKPNERYTHDIHITVEDRYQTLSNGILVKSDQRGNMRTDHWKMAKEHAPYLTMITVGEFAITEESWNSIPLLYYVEKDYGAFAQNIFNHTPEMLSYFSDITGVPYPWDQYAQVVIRDFVAGAMENTTAVTFGEFVQKTDRELIDNHNDDIVAHEMFHHWFGDYVTCESWANLTLNEGFANYSEYLWTQHQYGQAEADNKRHNELAGYFRQAIMQGTHPLIHYSYEDKENMFDAHSYNKGGLVLHMLRNKIGDEAFYAGMQKYLVDNANTSVEVHELRMAYEEVTGIDLMRFFDQWYLSSGHPELQINYSNVNENLVVDVEQIQSADQGLAVFEIDLEFDLHLINGQTVRKSALMNKRKQNIEFDVPYSEIDWINFDPQHVLLASYEENRNTDDYLQELLKSDSQFDQREAMDRLNSDSVDLQVYKDILVSDKHYIIKFLALKKLPFSDSEHALFQEAIEKADNVFLKGNLLAEYIENSQLLTDQYLLKILGSEKSWAVLAPALKIMSTKNAIVTKRYMTRYADENNLQLIYTMAQIYSEKQYEGGLDYILGKVPQLSERALARYTDYVYPYIQEAHGYELEEIMNRVNKLVFQSDKVYSGKKDVVKTRIESWYGDLEEKQLEIIKKIIDF